MRRRFFWGMVAVALTTLLAGGFAAAVLVSRSVEASARAEFARQAEATARLLEAELPGDGRPGVRLGQILRDVALVGGHEYVEAALVGPRGGVTVLGADRGLLDRVPGFPEVSGRVAFDTEVGGVEVTAVAQPIAVGERGTVIVVIGTGLELIPWRQVAARFLWALLLAVGLAALLAASLSRSVGRRVAVVGAATRAVARGDLGVRVPETGGDELAEMASGFNEMARQLEQARRREREFLVAVGHDLRTPLTTIAGYAEALREGRIGSPDLERVAGVLGVESGRLRRLVEDLMLLARIEAPEFALRPEPVDLAGLVRGLAEAFGERAAASGVVLETAIAPVGMVMVDPDRVAQVVGNLMENALRYTPEAGMVRLGLQAVAGDVEVSVADTGPGIEAGDLAHVFERSYVAARYRAIRPEGSGLGLAIVHHLVGAMGGSVAVESVPGSGSVFRVRLPGGGSGGGSLTS